METARIAGRAQAREPSGPELGIRTAREFQQLIKYERARADRASSRFALVSVELSSPPSAKQELMALLQALRRRIRTTDVLGWLDERTLSVLLPGTDQKGTETFTGDLVRLYGRERPPLPFTAYCYPEHWFRSESGANRIERAVEGTMARSLPVWKRVLDVGVALLGLALSSPLFLLLAVHIKLVSRGPVLFRQQRLGYRTRPFTFLKFRTMYAGNDPRCHQAHLKELIASDQPMEKLDSGRDPRIIPGGRLLRKVCLDEFPQLINVLRGEMSLVGPRPCLPYEAEEYRRWHSHRFDVLPGLTGLWQVSGKNRLTFKQMVRLDISYCQNMSLLLDLKILLRTIPVIIGWFWEGIGNRLRRAAQARTRAQ